MSEDRHVNRDITWQGIASDIEYKLEEMLDLLHQGTFTPPTNAPPPSRPPPPLHVPQTANDVSYDACGKDVDVEKQTREAPDMPQRGSLSYEIGPEDGGHEME